LFILLGYCCIQFSLVLVYDWYSNCLHYWGILVYSFHWFWCTIGIPIVYITGVLLYTVFTGSGVQLGSQLFTLLGYCCIECLLVLVYNWDPNCLHYWGIVVYSFHWFWCTIGIPIVYIPGVLLYTVFTGFWCTIGIPNVYITRVLLHKVFIGFGV
jgi:hypothetical protein